MNWKIPLFETYWDENDIESVNKVIRRGSYWACGPEIQEFENKLAYYTGRKYAVTFNSGTSALHSALLTHNIMGKEVIVPSFTFIATANAVLLAGGKPVFADIEDKTYGLDVESVKECITEKTKAVVPIHYGGCPARDIQTIREVCEDKKILLIEDAAESMGSKIKEKKVGTFGDSAMFSLCQNKIISTGEGGFIATDSEEEYHKLKVIRSQGRVDAEKDYFSTIKEMEYSQVGYNYRMPTIIAALGISQLKKIHHNILARRKNALYLDEKLQKINELKTLDTPKTFFNVYQMYTIQLKDQNTRDGLQKHLSENGVMSKVYFHPVHLKKLYQKIHDKSKKNLRVTEDLSKKVLALPMHPNLSIDQLDYILSKTHEYFNTK